jgi:hypothetical protein
MFNATVIQDNQVIALAPNLPELVKTLKRVEQVGSALVF